MKITNVSVTSLDRDMTTAAAGWELNGARFHVWFDLATRKMQKPVLYKNPIAKRGEPGYFDHTRKLNAMAPGNAKAIAEAFAIIEREDLIEKAKKLRLQITRQTEAENAQAARIAKIKEAGPELLAALRVIAGPENNPTFSDAADVARAAIAKVQA